MNIKKKSNNKRGIQCCYGHYPEKILAETVYRNHENHQWCKERGIQFSAPKSGRKTKEVKDQNRDKKQRNEDISQRNQVECKSSNL